MLPTEFSGDQFGKVILTPQRYYAYIPNELPPPLESSWELTNRLSKADRSLSELAGVTRTLPNPQLFVANFQKREAVLSSRIEGTQASLSDLFYFEAGEQIDQTDVFEVVNYINALKHGLTRLSELPLSIRLLREIHEKLMFGVRGDEARLTPGEIRRTQNWIGSPGCSLMEATYVPPPANDALDCLRSLENYIHAPSSLPSLIRVAIIHYQFEAIHPFLDGNGRLGRLLITLMLIQMQLIHEPILYLSAYFEKNRDQYYDRLLAVTLKGRWQDWIEFFLDGVAEQANDAIRRANELNDLWLTYQKRFQQEQRSVSVLRLLDEIVAVPSMTYRQAERVLGISPRAARQNVDRLVESGLLVEHGSRQRYRLFIAHEIIRIIDA